MGKTIFTVLLIMLSILTAAIAGSKQQAAPIEGDLLLAESDSPVQASGPVWGPISLPQNWLLLRLHNDFWASAAISPRFSIGTAPASKESIAALLFEHGPRPCWLSLAQSQGQGLTLNRVSKDTRLNHALIYRFARQYRQSVRQIPSKCSRHLLESSPPGFFLLV